MGLPPWHMWGSNVPIDVLGFDVPTSAQMVQVSYARPESWNFFFQGVVTRAENIDPATALDIDLDVTFGVGRSTVFIPSFARLTWGPGPASLQPNIMRMCTEVEQPAENLTRVSPNIIDHFVAQTIQVVARAALFESGPTASASVQLTVFLAPIVHVRPEWHVHQFPGDETKGK